MIDPAARLKESVIDKWYESEVKPRMRGRSSLVLRQPQNDGGNFLFPLEKGVRGILQKMGLFLRNSLLGPSLIVLSEVSIIKELAPY